VAPWVLCALALVLLGTAVWLRRLVPDQDPAGPEGWLSGTVDALGIAGIPVVGALMATRLPGNPYGWLWCATGVVYGLSTVARPLMLVLDGPLWLGWALETWAFVALVGSFTFVFLLFPTGRLPSRAWRWVGRAAVTGAVLLALAVPFLSDSSDPTSAGPWALQGTAGRRLAEAIEVGVYVMFGLVLVAMSSLVLRFLRAGPVERRQLTWFLYATVVNAVLLVLDALGIVPDGLLYTALSAAAFALLPVAVGVAVLRYRLYEIDRIVSRTVSYGLLTGGLIGVYLLVVALLRPLLEPLTGSSALAVAASTLAVAAVFNPARRRLQAAVDRRFNRPHYDAARAVDAFAARLRHQVDLDEVTQGLRDTVVSTVAPSRVGVWLSVPHGVRKG
jgi:hypothetical protein